jgi:hypothetical protein
MMMDLVKDKLIVGLKSQDLSTIDVANFKSSNPYLRKNPFVDKA